jgi:S1-C subfamily serine protease
MVKLIHILLSVVAIVILTRCQTQSTLGSGVQTMALANGDKYVGQVKDGKANGMGTYTSAQGSYVGQFKNGTMHGPGSYTLLSGDVIVAEFKNGMVEGKVKIIRPNGDVIIGKFSGGPDVTGSGTSTSPNGDRFTGEFRNYKRHGQGTLTASDGQVIVGIWENDKFKSALKVSPKVISKKPSPKVKNDPKPKLIPLNKSAISGSGFFVSKLGHIVTNQHVVNSCGNLTVGDNANTQVRAEVVETDKRNDLALLKISSTEMASVETKSLIRKLGLRVVPLSSNGLLRSDDVELGERLLVAGFPYGDIFSNTIKVTGGMVSAIRGIGDDTGQFQMDAAVQPGNSGGPIYDANGNIVGVVVAQLNKLKMAKAIGSMPENVNFGIKASTVRSFLTSSGLPIKWSSRSKSMSTKDLANIARNQTVMVVCHR